MEEGFEGLKELFQHKRTSVTLSTEVINRKASHDLSELKKNHLKNITALLATAFALVIIHKINSEKIETSLSGFILLLGCAIYYAMSKFYLLYKLRSIDSTKDVLQTIVQLEKYKKLNLFKHTYGEVIYLLVLNVGVYLYIQPVLDVLLKTTPENTLLFPCIIWGTLAVWTLFYIFGIKRKKMKKEVMILERYIQALKTETNSSPIYQ